MRASVANMGQHNHASLLLQAVPRYLRYPRSYRDVAELRLKRGLEGLNNA